MIILEYNRKPNDYLAPRTTNEEQDLQYMILEQAPGQRSKYICMVCSRSYMCRASIKRHLTLYMGKLVLFIRFTMKNITFVEIMLP